MQISLSGAKPEGEWSSFNELCGYGDGVKKEFKTPFPSEEARGLHVMSDLLIVAPNELNRVLAPDGSLLRDEPDGYAIKLEPGEPATIAFERERRLTCRVSVSALGRRPEKGLAFKILPMTDSFARKIDAKTPPDMKKKKSEDRIQASGLQDMYREAFMSLVVDFHGFTGEDGKPLPCNDDSKKAVVDKLGALVMGMFVADRARVIQQERINDREHDREG